MLDRDLAVIYETDTRSLNQAAKRNARRFPDDFRFQLTKEETDILRSQSVIFQWLQAVKYLPYAYTREGANMLSSVLHTDIAVDRSVFIMRAFSATEACHSDMKFSEQMTGDQFDISAKRFITALEVAKLAGITDEDEARRTANLITKHTTGVDMLNFVRSGHVPAPKPLQVMQTEEPLVMFVNAWWKKYGEEEIDSHYLRRMIIDSDIPLDIGRGNERSQKTRISRMLGKMKGSRVGSYYIVEAGTYRNSKLWKLKKI